MSDKGTPLFTDQFVNDYIRQVTMYKPTWEKISEYMSKSKDKDIRRLAKEIEKQINMENGY